MTHPSNKRERRAISKVKHFVKKSKDRAGHVRRKILVETQTVKELDHELEQFALREDSPTA